MNRRYKVVALLLLVALIVGSVYGALTFQFSKTYPADVEIIGSPYAFILSTDPLSETPPEIVGGIQFPPVDQGELCSTPAILEDAYTLVWTTTGDPPTGDVWLSFDAYIEVEELEGYPMM
ncbi:unnamed protein product, partial [marine sediment metagenome]